MEADGYQESLEFVELSTSEAPDIDEASTSAVIQVGILDVPLRVILARAEA